MLSRLSDRCSHRVYLPRAMSSFGFILSGHINPVFTSKSYKSR
jgi:hypothetical protein